MNPILEQLKAKVEAMTAGEWSVKEPQAIDWRDPLIYGADRKSLVAVTQGGGPIKAIGSPEQRANANGIVALKNTFSAPMLDTIGKMAEALEKLEKEVSTMFWTTDDGKGMRSGTPEDADAPETFCAAWSDAKSALATFNQQLGTP